MSQEPLSVKKRHSQTARAKAQQRQRRKRGLFKKAAEFCYECESDVFVAVRIRKTGQIYIFNSSPQSQWLNILPDLVCSIKVLFYPSTDFDRRRIILPRSRRRWRILYPSLSVYQIQEAHQLLREKMKGPRIIIVGYYSIIEIFLPVYIL